MNKLDIPKPQLVVVVFNHDSFTIGKLQIPKLLKFLGEHVGDGDKWVTNLKFTPFLVPGGKLLESAILGLISI
jgi:hypothetical protein